jgi:hypothetical protein
MCFETKTPKEAINYTRENPPREIVILVVAYAGLAPGKRITVSILDRFLS